MNVSIIRWALISALALPLLAHAQIYKWVDEKGVTSYGNKPPPNVAGLTTLTDGESRLSVIPSARPQPAPAARARSGEPDRPRRAQWRRLAEWRRSCHRHRTWTPARVA